MIPDQASKMIPNTAGGMIPEVKLPKSKSILNRVLLLEALRRGRLQPVGAGECGDLRELHDSLDRFLRGESEVFVRESGTALRFLCAYAAARATDRELSVTCGGRLAERPLDQLLEALASMGAKISEEYQDGLKRIIFRPTGRRLSGGLVRIDNAASSQFISALMLISSACGEPIEVEATGKVPSQPYIEMTRRVIEIFDRDPDSAALREADWSAAAFFYQAVASGVVSELRLPGLVRPGASLQGDSAAADLFHRLGVESRFEENSVTLMHLEYHSTQGCLEEDMSATPDLVPPIVGACLSQGRPFRLSGVETLRGKESDRIKALTEGAAALGFKLESTEDQIIYKAAPRMLKNLNSFSSDLEYITEKSGDFVLKIPADHRVAMTFSVILMSDGEKMPEKKVSNPESVEKSFPRFYREFRNFSNV